MNATYNQTITINRSVLDKLSEGEVKHLKVIGDHIRFTWGDVKVSVKKWSINIDLTPRSNSKPRVKAQIILNEEAREDLTWALDNVIFAAENWFAGRRAMPYRIMYHEVFGILERMSAE